VGPSIHASDAVNSDHVIFRKREYEERFGPYKDDDYRDPSQCPEDRRSLVAEIKVSSAALPLAAHLADYGAGKYPLPFAGELEPMFHKIIRWDPHLPRQKAPSTT
jgi:hypothetical protein